MMGAGEAQIEGMYVGGGKFHLRRRCRDMEVE
jgi:hypothetical protein